MTGSPRETNEVFPVGKRRNAPNPSNRRPQAATLLIGAPMRHACRVGKRKNGSGLLNRRHRRHPYWRGSPRETNEVFPVGKRRNAPNRRMRTRLRVLIVFGSISPCLITLIWIRTPGGEILSQGGEKTAEGVKQTSEGVKIRPQGGETNQQGGEAPPPYSRQTLPEW